MTLFDAHCSELERHSGHSFHSQTYAFHETSLKFHHAIDESEFLETGYTKQFLPSGIDP